MRLALLGDPVAGSLSPTIHEAALVSSGIKGEYEAREVDGTGLAAAFAELRHGRLDGANVTMPHKGAAFASCDRVAPAALQTGAANTLVAGPGEVFGHNTDVSGVSAAWIEFGLPEDGPVHVLGAGGAAAAALVALSDRDVIVSARRPGDADDLLARTRVKGSVVAWGNVVPGAVVINATPIGMAGERLPIPVDEGPAFFDMAYGTVVTPAVASARSAGIPTVAGPEMLLHQAAGSFELWTGLPAPIEEMRRTLVAELERRRGVA